MWDGPEKMVVALAIGLLCVLVYWWRKSKGANEDGGEGEAGHEGGAEPGRPSASITTASCPTDRGAAVHWAIAGAMTIELVDW